MKQHFQQLPSGEHKLMKIKLKCISELGPKSEKIEELHREMNQKWDLRSLFSQLSSIDDEM